MSNEASPKAESRKQKTEIRTTDYKTTRPREQNQKLGKQKVEIADYGLQDHGQRIENIPAPNSGNSAVRSGAPVVLKLAARGSQLSRPPLSALCSLLDAIFTTMVSKLRRNGT